MATAKNAIVEAPRKVRPKSTRPKVSADAKEARQAAHFDPWMTPAQAAEYCGFHLETMRQKLRLREIAAMKSTNGPSAHYRIRLSELNRWMKSREQKAL